MTSDLDIRHDGSSCPILGPVLWSRDQGVSSLDSAQVQFLNVLILVSRQVLARDRDQDLTQSGKIMENIRAK